jgi:hypothetical protein
MKFFKKAILFVGFFFLLINLPGLGQSTTTYTANDNGFAYIDNGTYKIGFNLQMGGIIDYLSKSNENNSIINSFDNGRQLGIDAYNGPDYYTDNIYKNQGYISACESSGVLCSRTTWNGLVSGSYDGNLGGAPNSITWNSTSKTLTIESKLWDWNMRQAGTLAKIYDQAEQTQVVTFVAPNVIKVKMTTNMHVNYLTSSNTNLVSPFAYLNGAFTKAAGYFGNNPFTNDPDLYNQAMPYWDNDTKYLNTDATERWAGLYNNANFGMAFVWSDSGTTFTAGTVSANNPDNGRYSAKSNYMYHVRLFNQTGYSVIENEFYLVLGSPSDARCWAYSLNGVSSSCAQCVAPAAPTLTASSTSVAPNTAVQLTSSGCNGTVTWSDGQTGNHTVHPTETTTYTATCTINGCTSPAGSVTVAVSGTPPTNINCSTLSSSFDFANCDVLGGWVYDSSNPNMVVNLDVYEGNTLIQANIPAGNFRQDLLNAGIGNGYHGFQFATPSQLKTGQNRNISLRASGCSYVFTNSPKTITCAGCTPPAAPSVTASATTITSGQSVTLTSSGCSGSLSWSTGQSSSSISVSPSQTTTYTATCTVNGCTSTAASVTVTVQTPTNPGTASCVTNKVRLIFRSPGDCCMDRLPGAKIQGSNNGSSWTDLYTFSTNGTGNWQEFSFSNTTAYSSLRFVASSTGWGEVAELEFYNGTTKLTGTSSGTHSSYPQAFDGNTSTKWEGTSVGSGNIIGLALTNCGSCTPPSAPTVSASATNVAPGTAVQLTSSGCSGTVTWSDGQTGNHTVTPSQTTTYTATCTVNGCTSTAASVTVTVQTPTNPGTASCVTNKVRLIFRSPGDCCMDRLPGAKIQGSNNGSSWTDLYTFSTNGTGNWQEFSFSNTTAYSSLRFVASSTGWGEVAELEFYNGTTKLTGTSSGTHSSYPQAFDGNTSTKWEGTSVGSGNIIGLALTNCGSCTPPASPSITASATTISSGQSVTLTSSGCSGNLNWSTGQTTATISVSPTQTTTYTATCTINGCTSSAGSATITVSGTPPTNINCATLGSSFDVANCDVLAGWVYDSSNPNTVLNLDVYEGSTLIMANIPAGNFRQDLLNAGIGNGYHGFQFETPSQFKTGQNRNISLRASGCSYVFTNSPKTINCGSCTPPASPSVTASATTITSGQSVTLTSNGCSGNLNWSTGQTTANISVSPTQTTTYTATCTFNGCTSIAGCATITVSGTLPTNINCATLTSDFGSASCDVLSGWVYDSSNPNTVVNLDVYEGSTLIMANIPAGNFRQDLLNAGIGNGYHGFQFETPLQLKTGQNRNISLRASGCSYVFANSPRAINCNAGARTSASFEPEEVIVEQELTVSPNPNTGIL